MAKCKQTGTPNSRPNSFVSVSKPPFPLAFHKPLLIFNCLPLNAVDHNLMQMQMRAWLSCWVGWPELAELRTRYLQTLALGSARDLTKCAAHRASGITAVLGVKFLTAVLSPRTLSSTLPVHLG